MSFFQIPGNIKQQFLPFVLNPGAGLNKSVKTSPELNSQCDPQYFTYKSSQKTFWSGKARLNFYPSSIQSVHINDDISFKLLYGYDPTTGKSTNASITVQDILNTIPGVQIREYLPDTRLDQCINMFTDLFKNMTKLFSDDNSENGSTDQGPDTSKMSMTEKFTFLCKRITAASWFTMKYMVGAYPNGDPSLLGDIGDVAHSTFSSYDGSFKAGTGVAAYVMKFPYTLYYNLQTCVTTGIFEVPGQTTDKVVLHSGGGMQGWTDGGSDFMSAGGMRLSGLLGKIPIVGNLANMILGNIGINYTPWWNAETGSKTKEPQIEIKFDLFNDSFEAAMYNFIFVNTIVPNNKWIQYNMFQHSSHIYDVKIEGINRLFACAGDFDVTYEGVLRDPPYSWVHTLVQKHANNNMNKSSFESNILNNHLIKIPDVYRVSLKFQSLLPANFNNYIFNYAENSNHIDTYYTHVYDQSAISEALPKAIVKYSNRVLNVWKTGKESTEAALTYDDNGNIVANTN